MGLPEKLIIYAMFPAISYISFLRYQHSYFAIEDVVLLHTKHSFLLIFHKEGRIPMYMLNIIK